MSWRTSLLSAAAGATAWTLSRVMGRWSPDAAGRIAAELDVLLARPLSELSGAVPFSVAELLVAGYLAWLAALVLRAGRDLATARRQPGEVAARGARRLLRDGGLVVLLFTALWGLNYARPGFAVESGWKRPSGVDVWELAGLLTRAVEEGNRAYLEIHGVADAGAVSALPADRGARRRALREMEAALDEGWERATEALSLPFPVPRPGDAVRVASAAVIPRPARDVGAHEVGVPEIAPEAGAPKIAAPESAAPSAGPRYGRVKYPLARGLLLRLGISGIYIPFTGEPHVTLGGPAVGIPMIMAHEKAHQRGYTGETDATFLGWVAASMAPDPRVRYSASLEAQNQLLRTLHAVAPDAAGRIVAGRLSGVQRDLAERRAFSDRYAGPLREVGAAVNDRYLRAAGVKGGLGDYQGGTWLMVEFARRRAGSGG